MTRPLTLIGLMGLSLLLAACGGGKDEIIFDTAVGPNTQAQMRTLPNDLRGDTDNRRHVPAPAPADMEPASSDGGRE